MMTQYKLKDIYRHMGVNISSLSDADAMSCEEWKDAVQQYMIAIHTSDTRIMKFFFGVWTSLLQVRYNLSRSHCRKRALKNVFRTLARVVKHSHLITLLTRILYRSWFPIWKQNTSISCGRVGSSSAYIFSCFKWIAMTIATDPQYSWKQDLNFAKSPNTFRRFRHYAMSSMKFSANSIPIMHANIGVLDARQLKLFFKVWQKYVHKFAVHKKGRVSKQLHSAFLLWYRASSRWSCLRKRASSLRSNHCRNIVRSTLNAWRTAVKVEWFSVTIFQSIKFKAHVRRWWNYFRNRVVIGALNHLSSQARRRNLMYRALCTWNIMSISWRSRRILITKIAKSKSQNRKELIFAGGNDCRMRWSVVAALNRLTRHHCETRQLHRTVQSWKLVSGRAQNERRAHLTAVNSLSAEKRVLKVWVRLGNMFRGQNLSKGNALSYQESRALKFCIAKWIRRIWQIKSDSRTVSPHYILHRRGSVKSSQGPTFLFPMFPLLSKIKLWKRWSCKQKNLSTRKRMLSQFSRFSRVLIAFKAWIVIWLLREKVRRKANRLAALKFQRRALSAFVSWRRICQHSSYLGLLRSRRCHHLANIFFRNVRKKFRCRMKGAWSLWVDLARTWRLMSSLCVIVERRERLTVLRGAYHHLRSIVNSFKAASVIKAFWKGVRHRRTHPEIRDTITKIQEFRYKWDCRTVLATLLKYSASMRRKCQLQLDLRATKVGLSNFRTFSTTRKQERFVLSKAHRRWRLRRLISAIKKIIHHSKKKFVCEDQSEFVSICRNQEFAKDVIVWSQDGCSRLLGKLQEHEIRKSLALWRQFRSRIIKPILVEYPRQKEGMKVVGCERQRYDKRSLSLGHRGAIHCLQKLEKYRAARIFLRLTQHIWTSKQLCAVFVVLRGRIATTRGQSLQNACLHMTKRQLSSGLTMLAEQCDKKNMIGENHLIGKHKTRCLQRRLYNRAMTFSRLHRMAKATLRLVNFCREAKRLSFSAEDSRQSLQRQCFDTLKRRWKRRRQEQIVLQIWSWVNLSPLGDSNHHTHLSIAKRRLNRCRKVALQILICWHLWAKVRATSRRELHFHTLVRIMVPPLCALKYNRKKRQQTRELTKLGVHVRGLHYLRFAVSKFWQYRTFSVKKKEHLKWAEQHRRLQRLIAGLYTIAANASATLKLRVKGLQFLRTNCCAKALKPRIMAKKNQYNATGTGNEDFFLLRDIFEHGQTTVTCQRCRRRNRPLVEYQLLRSIKTLIKHARRRRSMRNFCVAILRSRLLLQVERSVFLLRARAQTNKRKMLFISRIRESCRTFFHRLAV